MKRYLFFMASMFLAMGLIVSACKKDPVKPDSHTDDGGTGKKISKIYCATSSELGTSRWLSEEWHWTSNGKLERIDHLNNDGSVQYSMGFVYEGQVLARVNYDTDYYALLQYDNGKLKEVRYYGNGSLGDVYTFTYENGELKTIVFQSNGVNSKAEEFPISVLRFVLPEPSWRFVESMEKRSEGRSAKSSYTTTITLTWSGGNVSRMDYSEVIEGGYAHEMSEEMQYDTCQNPYYDCYNGELNVVRYFSKNNLRSLVSAFDGQVYHQTFDYTYDGQYPKTQSITSDGSTYVLTYEFEYL